MNNKCYATKCNNCNTDTKCKRTATKCDKAVNDLVDLKYRRKCSLSETENELHVERIALHLTSSIDTMHFFFYQNSIGKVQYVTFLH